MSNDKKTLPLAEYEHKRAKVNLRLAMERRSQALVEMLTRNPDAWFSNCSLQTEHRDREVIMLHHGAAWAKEWAERRAVKP